MLCVLQYRNYFLISIKFSKRVVVTEFKIKRQVRSLHCINICNEVFSDLFSGSIFSFLLAT